MPHSPRWLKARPTFTSALLPRCGMH